MRKIFDNYRHLRDRWSWTASQLLGDDRGTIWFSYIEQYIDGLILHFIWVELYRLYAYKDSYRTHFRWPLMNIMWRSSIQASFSAWMFVRQWDEYFNVMQPACFDISDMQRQQIWVHMLSIVPLQPNTTDKMNMYLI